METNLRKLAITRDDKGRLLPGTKANNPNGRPKIGMSVSEFGRKFLEATPNGTRKSRLRQWWDALHVIASDPTNKQCVAAISLGLTRAYGEVPREISINVAAMQMLTTSGLSPEAQAYLIDKITQGDESYLIADTGIDDDETKLDAAEPAQVVSVVTEKSQ